MKYLVVSDSHGHDFPLNDILTKWETDIDCFIHCGDSELKENDLLWTIYRVVKGNCDYENFPEDTVVETQLDRIYVTHGHLCDVNYSLEGLISQAKQNRASIALYGHTHQLHCEMIDGVLVLNPGSICYPRGRYHDLKTYAVIEHDESGYVVQYYNEKHQVKENLTVKIPKI